MKSFFTKLMNSIKRIKLEKSTSVIANICQILIVILAIFEYQKNIKPAFQNQLLSEENAKLTIENKKLQEESIKINDAFSCQIREKEKQIELLQDKYTDINNQYEIAYRKLQVIETEQKNKEHILRIQKEKEEIIDSINSFKSEILKKCGTPRSLLIFNDTFTTVVSKNNKEEVPEEESLYYNPLLNIDKMISRYFYNPYTKILKSLDEIQSENLKNENIQTTEYISVFKSILKEKQHYIVFEQEKVINLENELKKYKKQLEKLEGITIKDDINILNKRWQIENTARKAVQEVEDSLIDYGDIMKPVIDEMTSYYLNKYKIEEY